jgi:hypothetical protein
MPTSKTAPPAGSGLPVTNWLRSSGGEGPPRLLVALARGLRRSCNLPVAPPGCGRWPRGPAAWQRTATEARCRPDDSRCQAPPSTHRPSWQRSCRGNAGPPHPLDRVPAPDRPSREAHRRFVGQRPPAMSSNLGIGISMRSVRLSKALGVRRRLVRAVPRLSPLTLIDTVAARFAHTARSD